MLMKIKRIMIAIARKASHMDGRLRWSIVTSAQIRSLPFSQAAGHGHQSQVSQGKLFPRQLNYGKHHMLSDSSGVYQSAVRFKGYFKQFSPIFIEIKLILGHFYTGRKEQK